MDFTIYTSGSAEFLELMLNGTAMILGSGTAEDLAKIGALLGMLLLAFQGAFNNQPISFQKAGLMLVLYMAFFGPSVTTVIEDTVSNQIRVVDNVPLGPAFVGSVISTISYEITKVSEQAFSAPEMTKYGLFSSLSTLAKVRDALRNPTSLDAFSQHKSSAGWDFPRTVREYLTFCTLNPVMLRTDKTVDQLYRSNGMAEIMSAVGTSQYVNIYDGSNPQNMKSCGEAGAIIKGEMVAIADDIFNEIMMKAFSSEFKAGRIINSTNVSMLTQNSIDNMGLAGKSAQDYVLTSVIEPVFNTSRVDALNHWQDHLTAVALRDSLNQQQIQWAGKGDSFKHYMRPMIAFFEGLLYAMTPFMAFALFLGGPGLKVLSKYLVLPLAVGLWMPLLSIVNAFTLWYAGAEIEAIGMGYDPTSAGFAMSQLMDIDQAISKALGVGGLLAASVPPLALFIVSGSAMVANGIMGQMTAADKFRSEDVNPRASNGQAPVLTNEARYSSDQATQGVAVNGMRNLSEKYSLSNLASGSVKSAESAAESSSTQLAETVRAGTQNLTSSSTGRQAMSQMGSTLASSSVLANNSEFAQAQQQLRDAGFSEQQVNQLTAAAAVDASASVKAGNSTQSGTGTDGKSNIFNSVLGSITGGVQGNLKTSAGNTNTTGSTTTETNSNSQAAAARLVKSLQSVDKKDLAFATSDAYLSSNQATANSSEGREVAKARSAAMESRRAYEAVEAFQSGQGAGQEMGVTQMAAESLRRGGSRAEFVDNFLAKDENLFRDYQKELAKPTLQALSSNEDERHMIAGMRALANNGHFHEVLNSKWNPFDINHDEYNAHKNQDLKNNSTLPTMGELDGKLGGAIEHSRGQYAAEVGAFEAGKQEQQSGAVETLTNNTANNNSGVLTNNANNNELIQSQGSQTSLEGIMKTGESVRLQGASEISVLGRNLGSIEHFGGLENATSKAGRMADLMQTATLQPKQVDAAIANHKQFGIDAGLTPAQAQYRALVKMGYGPDDERVQNASMAVQAEASALAASTSDPAKYNDYGRGVIQTLHDGAAGKGATNSDGPSLRQISRSREALKEDIPMPSRTKERSPTSFD